MSKIIKIVFPIVWFIIFTILYFFTVLSSIRYLWFILGWVICIRIFRMRSKETFILTFILFIIASTLTLVSSLNLLAETIMRASFITLIIGYIQKLVEYMKSSPCNDPKQLMEIV